MENEWKLQLMLKSFPLLLAKVCSRFHSYLASSFFQEYGTFVNKCIILVAENLPILE